MSFLKSIQRVLSIIAAHKLTKLTVELGHTVTQERAAYIHAETERLGKKYNLGRG